MRHFWVDRVEIVQEGVEARGYKAVGLSEDYFREHFPGNPVFPGIYLVEGMAQTAGAMLARASGWQEFALMVSVDRARFSSFVRPGERVEYHVVLDDRAGDFARVTATAEASDGRVAQVGLTFRILPLEAMIPALHIPAWNDALALLFDPGAGTREDDHS